MEAEGTMSKFKSWLCTKFLPMWCREELLGENRRLRRALAEARQENERLNAYIDGVQSMMRCLRRVEINQTVRRAEVKTE